MRLTEQFGRFPRLAFMETLTNPRRGYESPVNQRRLDGFEVDADLVAPRGEDLHITLTVASECEIRAFDEPAGPELAADDLIEKLAGRQTQEPVAGLKHPDLAGPGTFQELNFTLGPDQWDRNLVGAEQSHGMRIERDRHGGHSRGVGLGP